MRKNITKENPQLEEIRITQEQLAATFGEEVAEEAFKNLQKKARREEQGFFAGLIIGAALALRCAINGLDVVLHFIKNLLGGM